MVRHEKNISYLKENEKDELLSISMYLLGRTHPARIASSPPTLVPPDVALVVDLVVDVELVFDVELEDAREDEDV